MIGICECKQPHVSADSLRCIICKRLLPSITLMPKPQRTCQISNGLAKCQLTTSDAGLIVSVSSKHDEWSSILINAEQIAALKGFINDIG